MVVNIVMLGLLAFLFGAVSRLCPEKQLRLWVAAWLLVMAHFAFELWNPASVFLQHLQMCLIISTLALSGVCFALSKIVLRETVEESVGIGVWLATTTTLFINLLIFGPPPLWLLYCFVVIQHIGSIAIYRKNLRKRPKVLRALTVIQALGLWCMLTVLSINQTQFLIPILLVELFVAAAADFWFDIGEHHSLGLTTTCIGLFSWGMVFPSALITNYFWPILAVDSEIWNVPKFCTAVGMILMVMEEDARAARTLSEEYRLLFDSNPHPLWIFDSRTLEFLSVNQAALDKHQYTREEFLQLTVPDLIDPPYIPRVMQELAVPYGRPIRASRHIRKDGSLLSMDITAHDIVFHERPCRLVIGIDVTEREALNQQLLHQARHDVLTGLPNRMLFHDLLAKAVANTIRAQEKLAIICLDLHHFKGINDTYGPNVGDECLKRVASILSSRVRTKDIVARTGGEEFAIVLPELKSPAMVEYLVNELKQTFSQPLLVSEYKVHISINIGVAICPDDGASAAHLWRGAENALCQAQESGSGQVVWFSPELSSAFEEKMEIEAYMRYQLPQGGFHLVYQPLYAFDGKVHELEALLRLTHPKYGAVSPAKFIPIAEETGLIVPIGEWVIEEVCRQIREWDEQDMQLVPIALNVSAIQLAHSEFADHLMSTLKSFGVNPEWIELEVTESAVVLNMAEVATQMKALSTQGVRFSIDDFGTGHSSLGRLDRLPISTLKIDRSFVERICTQDGTYSIVQAIIAMTKSLGMRVVAEGVDREDQIERLRELDCDYLQGFLLSRPLKPQAVPSVVNATYPVVSPMPAVVSLKPARSAAQVVSATQDITTQSTSNS
jgi:diguanylate cyclase (GGDEF)-like protein/PAS domain S-box-containing protein